jgi:catechol 2,3-dioxygenase-like lactoylglutathione lyase family enzyme
VTLAWRITSVPFFAICATWSPSAVPAEPAAHVGVSHVNIAVADLERASADYARLGFALKEGRPHPDGIRNRHVKFRDGTEIELITAPEATDALTTHYRQLIQAGDGPAFLSLDVEPPALAVERVKQAGLPASTNGGNVDFPFESPLGYVFFAGLNQSPTDRPEHFAHANGATSLVGVTLAGENLDPERTLFRAFGLPESSCVGAGSASERPSTGSGDAERCVSLHDGSVVRLRHGAVPGGRRIAALEVRVVEVATVIRVLESAHVPFRTDPARAGVTVDGEMTHGVALTFATGAAHDAR